MLHGADNPNRIGLLPGEKPPRPTPTFESGNYSINWLSTTIICTPPLLVLAAVLYGVPLTTPTFIAAVVFYFLHGLGITVGYHRLFSHRSFTASKPVEQVLGFLGAGALQGSARWWCRNHRVHHNFIDTDLDPYNAKRGFFYSHLGWMLMKQDYETLGYVDISDLNANRYITFQHNWYMPIALFSGVALPTLVCGLGWGDWLGGYFYAALAKVVFVHHSTFFINSLAHSSLFGAEQNFSEEHTSHDSWVCSVLALGEGYHNFHHSHVQDHRNGIMWYHWDPTKWIIRLLEVAGHAKHLVRVPNAVIERSRATVSHAKAQREVAALDKALAAMDRSVAVATEWTWAEVERKCEQEQRKLIVVGNYVLDIERQIPTGSGYTHNSTMIDWSKAHPGGYKIMDAFIGKDATDAMTGGVYKHSAGAFNLLQHLRVASLKRD